jgi:phenylalanyl-tRNA synthetase beta chain
VQFSLEQCRKLIGFAIPDETVQKILENLGFRIALKNGDTLFLEVPPYRVDVTREADVVEEVLRIYGYNRIPLPDKLNTSLNHFAKPDAEKVQRIVSDTLVGMGFFETLNNSLTKAKYVDDLGGEVLRKDQNVDILNPLSQDLSVMRQTLIFNALEVVEHNQNRQHPDLRIFEFGKIYRKFGEQYAENRRLLLLITGSKEQENWNSNKDQFSFYSIKSYALNIMDRLGLMPMVQEKALKKSIFEDGIQLMVNKNRVGEIGWLDQKVLKYFGIRNPVFIADLDFDAILTSVEQVEIKYSELPKTFAVRRDFSLLMNKETSFAELENIAFEVDRKLLRNVGLFDVYEGNKLPEGKKSYALSFYFQDNERTLKDEQIDAIMERLRNELESKLSVQLRS